MRFRILLLCLCAIRCMAQVGETDTYDIENMQPLQHQNNAKKGDNYPRWQTEVSAEGNHSVTSIRNWYVNRH